MIYVMSDIHGNAIRFNSIMEQIDLQPEDTLYILGDVIDRYPDGIRILRLLMSMFPPVMPEPGIIIDEGSVEASVAKLMQLIKD